MQKIKEDPPVIHFRGNSKTKKHRLSKLQAQEAEKDIKEYVDSEIQNSVCRINLQE